MSIELLPRSLYPLDPHHDSLTEAVLSAIEDDQWWGVDGFSNLGWQRVEDINTERQTTMVTVQLDGGKRYVVGSHPSRIPSIFDGETEFNVAQIVNHDKPGPTWLWPLNTNPFASLH